MQQAIWLEDSPVALLTEAADGTAQLVYIQPDHLGTPRVVIDPARNKAIWTWRNQGEVFGHQEPNTDPDGDGVAFELSMRFPGQQATETSGLFYNYQREYDPESGRYTQSDPIGLMGGISTYGYVSGNPLSSSDRLGLQAGRARVVRPLLPPHSDNGYQQWNPDLPNYGGSLDSGPSVGTGLLQSPLQLLAMLTMSLPIVADALWVNKIGASKDGSSSKPNDCPTGTLPIDKAKKPFGLDHEAVETIKYGSGAGASTWTGIAPNGDIWVGTGDGKGRLEGNISDYGFGR